MKALRNILNKILNALAGISFIAMVVLTCWQVFTRYVLQNPSSWSEELVSYLFAWASLLGASLVTGERGHMNIPIIVERMGICHFRRADCLRVLCGYSGIRRNSDHQSCNGTDDVLFGRSRRYFLYRASSVRRAEHGLYRAEYYRHQQRKG